MHSLAAQTWSFIITIGAGAMVGLLFDVYRIVRSIFRPKHFGVALLDLIFWLAVTPILFASLLAANWGELRFYVVLGLGIGFLVYFQIVSTYVLWFLQHATWHVGRTTGTTMRKVATTLAGPGRAWQRVRRRPGGSSMAFRRRHRTFSFHRFTQDLFRREAWRRFGSGQWLRR